MSQEQLRAWKKALTDQAKAARRQRGRHRTKRDASAYRPGMARRQPIAPPKENPS
jgi:hypothetical protein